jgi:hypothetical protein
VSNPELCSSFLAAANGRLEENMNIRKIEIERIGVTASKPFETVVTALEAAVGHPDMNRFGQATKAASTFWRVGKSRASRAGSCWPDDVYPIRFRGDYA